MNTVLKVFLTAIIIHQFVNAEVNEPDRTLATCYETVQSGHMLSNTNKLQFYRPFNPDAFVMAVNMEGVQEKIPAVVTMGSWITYKAIFKYNGQDVRIEFSNYQSPSIGTMSADGGEKISYLACELTRTN